MFWVRILFRIRIFLLRGIYGKVLCNLWEAERNVSPLS